MFRTLIGALVWMALLVGPVRLDAAPTMVERMPEPNPPVIELDIPEAPSARALEPLPGRLAGALDRVELPQDRRQPAPGRQRAADALAAEPRPLQPDPGGDLARHDQRPGHRGRAHLLGRRSVGTSSGLCRHPGPAAGRLRRPALHCGQGPLGLSHQHRRPDPHGPVRPHRRGRLQVHGGRRHRLLVLRAHRLRPRRLQHRLGLRPVWDAGSPRAPQRHHVDQHLLQQRGVRRRAGKRHLDPRSGPR